MKLNGNSHGLTRLLLILAAALLLLIGTASLAEEGRNPSSRSGESAPQTAPGGVEDDNRIGDQLDLPCCQIGIFATRWAALYCPADLQNKFAARLRSNFVGGGLRFAVNRYLC